MEKRNKIVFIAPSYVPAPLSGSEVIVRDLAETLYKMRYISVVITSNVLSGRSWYDPFYPTKIASDHAKINGVEVVRLPCAPLFSALLFIFNICTKRVLFQTWIFKKIGEQVELLSWGPILKGLEKTVLECKPDVVVLSPFPAGICLTGQEICRRHNIPYCVIPFFKKDQKLFENRLLGTILDQAYSIFTPTLTEKNYIQRFTNNKNIFLLPSSIDRMYIKIHETEILKEAGTLQRQKPLEGKKIVLFVGNKGKGKGIFDALSAVERLRRDNVIFITMGNNSREWNTYLHSSAKPPWIIDIPYRDGIEKYAYYKLCDVLILPSTTDNFPLVFLEAWQFRKPVLAYDYYSMNEIAGDGSGFLAKNQNRNDLSRCLGYILDHPDEARRAGNKGYGKMKYYTRERITEAFFMKGLPV
jgi:glycosyltransferase involved in cell wall biosynthesis